MTKVASSGTALSYLLRFWGVCASFSADREVPLSARGATMERRLPGWFLFSAVFVTVVFGLFFTVTERKSWPEQRLHLAASDMRLAPRASTVWCEAVALSSDHPFVAYQVSHAPNIDPKVLTRQKADLTFRLASGQTSTKLKFFLLQSTVVEISACASAPGAHVAVFKGEGDDVGECLHRHSRTGAKESSLSTSDYYSEDSSDYDDDDDDDWVFEGTKVVLKRRLPADGCESCVSIQEIPVSQEGKFLHGCDEMIGLHPLKINITSADEYVIAIGNSNPHRASNVVSLHLQIDRATYAVRRAGQSLNICSLSTACTIALDFGSDERALVWIPEEPNAGRATYSVRVRCRPRLALFAVLSVCLPLLLFAAVAYIVRADRNRSRTPAENGSTPAALESQEAPLAALLLPRPPSLSGEADRCVSDSGPPSYDSLYERPPPYSCVKAEEVK